MPNWVISEPIYEADQICPMYKVWPWNGHRRFAYDLVRFINPRRIVELGTYWGTSFFSFCQAVKDHDFQTECVAVDTWEGDNHTGPYNTDVYDTVEKIVNQYFKKINIRLIKEYFSIAKNQVENKSVDILHIDGLHSYEAVKSDYETWLPKLSANGVVLFHDIADDCNYGSVKFWKEISSMNPSFSFQHSWGLGILFPNEKTLFNSMKGENFDDKLKIYEYASKLTLSEIQVQDLENFNQQQDEIIKSQDKVIADIIAEKKRLSKIVDQVQQSNVGKALKRLGLLMLD